MVINNDIFTVYLDRKEWVELGGAKYCVHAEQKRLYRRDHYHALSQPYNFGAETHLGGGDTSAFVMPSAAIAQSFSSTFVANTALPKGLQRF